MDYFSQFFNSGSLAEGGIILTLIAGLGWWLKDAIPEFIKFLSTFFISSVRIDTRDSTMFDTVLTYMDNKKSIRNINQFTARMIRKDEWKGFHEDIQNNDLPQIVLSPAPGFHIFTLEGRVMWMYRNIQVAEKILETITISCFGRDKKKLENIIYSSLEERIAQEFNKIAIYIPKTNDYSDGEWQRARLSNQRRLRTVILKHGQAEEILSDLQKFYDSRSRYEELGISWRRGYLLTGSPGTGKTSLVTALACEMRLNVCSMSLASKGISDDKISAMLSNIPPRSLILIEDVDAFFVERERQSEEVKLSFSGFLNALDGVAAHEGSVLFITTNHPEKLDAALIRSGRIDYRIELTDCDEYQLKGMYMKFFNNEVLAEKFAHELIETGKKYSPAYVQEKLLLAKDEHDAFRVFHIPEN